MGGNQSEGAGDGIGYLGVGIAEERRAAGNFRHLLQAVLISFVQAVGAVANVNYKKGCLAACQRRSNSGDLLLDQGIGKLPAKVVAVARIDHRVCEIFAVVLHFAIGHI
jgi:hypothetical protein